MLPSAVSSCVVNTVGPRYNEVVPDTKIHSLDSIFVISILSLHIIIGEKFSFISLYPIIRYIRVHYIEVWLYLYFSMCIFLVANRCYRNFDWRENASQQKHLWLPPGKGAIRWELKRTTQNLWNLFNCKKNMPFIFSLQIFLRIIVVSYCCCFICLPLIGDGTFKGKKASGSLAHNLLQLIQTSHDSTPK